MIGLSRNSGTAFASKISDKKKPQQKGNDMQKLCFYYATVTIEDSRSECSIMIALSRHCVRLRSPFKTRLQRLRVYSAVTTPGRLCLCHGYG
jgi:hypothetical protein